MCRSLEFSKKEKFLYRKTDFSVRFSEKKIFGLNARDPHIFEISVKFRFFDTLCAQFRQFRRNSFSTLIRDGAIILEVKRSNKIETVQYVKKTLFYKLVLGFQGQTIII
jgi:hypothetical protein